MKCAAGTPSFKASFLLDLTEAMTGSVTLVLRRDDEELARVDHSVEVLARNEWGGYAAMPELVAAFSMPNDPAVDRLLGQAAEILRSAGPSFSHGRLYERQPQAARSHPRRRCSIGALDVSYREPLPERGRSAEFDRCACGGPATRPA